MNKSSLKGQQGFTMLGLMLTAAGVIMLAVLSMKLVPVYAEFTEIKSFTHNLQATSEFKNMPSAEIKDRFAKMLDMNNIKGAVVGDLEINNEGGSKVLYLDYQRSIELFGPFTLIIELNTDDY